MEEDKFLYEVPKEYPYMPIPGDIIGKWDSEKQEIVDKFRVQSVKDNRIFGAYLDQVTRNLVEWSGNYQKVCSTKEELQEREYNEDIFD